ncbi:MAG: hypothetical protein ACRDOK_10620 [Streptosporangiaceae bacterium]
MRARTATYRPRNWRVRWPVLRYWHDSFIRLPWPPRILGWLVTGSLASVAGWQYIPLGPVSFEIAFMTSVALDARRVRRLPGPVALENQAPLARALRAEARRQAALPRVASPGGWDPPAGVRPAWNWTPPSGITPRLDRVPLWARLWYSTPLMDRYAHAWLWHHGGWDVVPPEAWSPPMPA